MKNNNGFTLIELIIYIALVSIFLTGSIIFLWDIIHTKEKAIKRNLETYQTLTIHGKANYLSEETSTASDFIAGLNLPGVTTADRSTEDSINVKAEFEDVESTWELKKPVIEARSLLTNLILAILDTDNVNLLNITIKNSSDAPIVIDQMYLEWENTTENPNVIEIQIDGGDPEWTGSISSGNTVDINDVTIGAGASAPVDYIEFDGDANGGNMVIEFIMQDGSRARGEFNLTTEEGVGGTGSTPCSEWCEDNGYSYGICDVNAQQCVNDGGTHGSGGDEYCTGGSDADTCCCFD